MRKVLLIALLAVIPTMAFAFNPTVFKGEQQATVNTTAKVITLTNNGYLSVFANGGKMYFNEDPAGVTANTSNNFLVDGGELDSGDYYFAGQKFSVLADTGTITVNITSRDLLRR